MDVSVRARDMTEKEHMNEEHHSHVLQNGPALTLHSLQVFASEMKEDGVITISIYQRRLLSTGKEAFGRLCAKGKFWHLWDAVPVITMNRSVHPVNFEEHGPGSRFSN